ncbi:MAG: metal-dependent hydrolase, partial [Clostridiales bacterium]|nr:metal-dependent hydrolase [Clostridiales bacterium]
MPKLLVEDIEIEVQRKKIRQMHLYVLSPEGNVRITAPKTISEAVIREFAVSRLEWI